MKNNNVSVKKSATFKVVMTFYFITHGATFLNIFLIISVVNYRLRVISIQHQVLHVANVHWGGCTGYRVPGFTQFYPWAVWAEANKHTHTHTHTHKQIHTNTHTQTHTNTHTHTQTDTHKHTHTDTHKHTYTHIHRHTSLYKMWKYVHVLDL